MKRLLLSLPDDVHEDIKREAKEDNRNVHNYIQTIVLDRKKGPAPTDPNVKG